MHRIPHVSRGWTKLPRPGSPCCAGSQLPRASDLDGTPRFTPRRRLLLPCPLCHSVELQPTAQGYFELGRTLAQTGHIPEALDAYQQALKISPDLVEAQQAINTLRQQTR